MIVRSKILGCLSLALVAAGCADRGSPAKEDASAPPSASHAREAPPPVTADAGEGKDGGDGDVDAAPAVDPADVSPLHRITQDALLELISLAPGKKWHKRDPREFLLKYIGPGGPGQTNQGNPELARHVIARSKCLEGLRGVTLQTEAQKATCGGHENMVPVYKDGDPAKAKACIDIFEYPNRACELPMVWVPPAHAAALCELQGKRLCTQDEWVLACRGDPEGAEPSTYAYGSELDLEVCNTNKPAAKWSDKPCDPRTIDTTWVSCSTNTEPSGSYPRCRSRFGVYDQHGNVAEAMTRLEPEDSKVYSQLKGSAFFYVDVARKLSEPPEKTKYSDHCAHDPRWHVQPIRKAFHVNYHLGFRCCYALDKR